MMEVKMRPCKYPDYVKAQDLADEFGIEPLLAKVMIYFRQINGLCDAGAIMILHGSRVMIHKEKFQNWMERKKLPKSVIW
jgi:hypothetical protein